LHTYLFSNEDVRCYVQELANRLESDGKRFPFVWYTLGESGDKIAEVLHGLIDSVETKNLIDFQPIYFNRTDKTVLLRDGGELLPYTCTNPALLLDGAVHSGTSMGEAAKRIAA
jgi:hypothetical protein